MDAPRFPAERFRSDHFDHGARSGAGAMDVYRAADAHGDVAANASDRTSERSANFAERRNSRSTAPRSDTPGERSECRASSRGGRSAPARFELLDLDSGTFAGELAEQVAGHTAVCSIEPRAIHARLQRKRQIRQHDRTGERRSDRARTGAVGVQWNV